MTNNDRQNADTPRITIDNETMDRLIRGLAVPVTTDEGDTVDVMLDDEGLGFIRGRIRSGDVPEVNDARK